MPPQAPHGGYHSRAAAMEGARARHPIKSDTAVDSGLKFMNPVSLDPAMPPKESNTEAQNRVAEGLETTSVSLHDIISQLPIGWMSIVGSVFSQEILASFGIGLVFSFIDGWLLPEATTLVYIIRACIFAKLMTTHRTLFKRAYADLNAHFGSIWADRGYGHVPNERIMGFRFLAWILQSGFSIVAMMAGLYATNWVQDDTVEGGVPVFSPTKELPDTHRGAFVLEMLCYAGVRYVFYNQYQLRHSAEGVYNFLKRYQDKNFSPAMYHQQTDGSIYQSSLYLDANYTVPRTSLGGAMHLYAYSDEESPEMQKLMENLYMVSVFILTLVSGSPLCINYTLAFLFVNGGLGGNWWVSWVAQVCGEALALLFNMYKSVQHRRHLLRTAVGLRLLKNNPMLLSTAAGRAEMKKQLRYAPLVYKEMLDHDKKDKVATMQSENRQSLNEFTEQQKRESSRNEAPVVPIKMLVTDATSQ